MLYVNILIAVNVEHNLMHYNFFGTQLKFQIMFNAPGHITSLCLKAYHVECRLYLSEETSMWGKHRSRGNLGHLERWPAVFFKVCHAFLNHLFLPLFWSLSISSCVIYLDDIWVRHFPVGLCYLASNISFFFCIIRLKGRRW